MTLALRPVPIRPARAHVLRTHRRLPRLLGGMFAIGLYDAGGLGDLVGVAVVGRPNARLLDSRGRLQVLRLAVEPGLPNACSMLYGACARAARAMGAVDLLTYTHLDEPGTSLRAAGWAEVGPTRGGESDRPSRARRPVADARPKRRWFAPWSETVRGARP